MIKSVLVAATLWGLTFSAQSQASSFDVEIDPLAYMFEGYSLHIAHSSDLGRIDVGVFGLKLPESFMDVENFEAQMSGYGMKWDRQKASSPGLFTGIEVNNTKVEVKHTTSLEQTTLQDVSAGVRGGYRFIYGQFTVSPWLGLDVLLSDTDQVVLGGETWKRDKLIVFPTVHLGYLF